MEAQVERALWDSLLNNIHATETEKATPGRQVSVVSYRDGLTLDPPHVYHHRERRNKKL